MTKRTGLVAIALIGLFAQPAARTALAQGASPAPAASTAPASAAGSASDWKQIQSLYSAGQFEAALLKLEDFERDYPNDPKLSEAYNYHGLIYILTHRSADAVPELRKAIGLEQNPTHRQFMLYNLAAAQLDAGQAADAAATAAQIDPGALDADTRAKLDSLKARVGATPGSPSPSPSSSTSPVQTEPGDPTKVGVLLPLHGRFAEVGTRSLQGVELAFRVFNSDAPDSKVTLVLQDSGESADQEVAGLNALASKHVVAVVGPLLSRGIDKVVARAQQLQIPVISLAQKSGGQSDYVFESAVTPRSQAQQVAKYAVKKLGLRRFAILASRDKFGDELGQYFWDAVDAEGGQITGMESYDSNETDFRHVVDKLVGLYYTDARQDELDELAKQRKDNNIKKRTRKTEQYYQLKPIVDFDAVFIPDEPKVLGQLLPTFAYRDVDHMQFLGISTWHAPDLISRAGGAAEGAVFPDAFFSASKAAAVQKFVASYSSTFDQQPGSIEAEAYDAASLLDHVLSDGAKDRGDVRDKLREIHDFDGATGKISYLAPDPAHGMTPSFQRELKILTVKQGKFIERDSDVAPSPASSK